MNYMLCRNRVRNFDQWKHVFDNNADAHRAAGLKLVHLWYELNSPRNVFFLFEVEDIERARAFLDSAAATASERESGLIEGDFRFFSRSLGYGPLDEAESQALAEVTRSVAATKETNDSPPAAPVNDPAPPEPVKSAAPVKSPEPEKSAEPVKSPEPEKSPLPEQSPTLSESVKAAEPVSSSTPPPPMKGFERVKSPKPVEPFEGWAPVENWPPAEAAAEVANEPSHHRRRWERIKY